MTREALLLERTREWAPAEPGTRRRWLERHGLVALLPDLLGPNEARSWTLQNLADNALIRRHAEQVVAALATEGLPAVFLKGLDLIDRVYRDREGVRRTSDVDLLVDHRRLDAALDVLERLGYRHAGDEPRRAQCRWSHHVTYEGPNQVDVEAHHILSQDMGFFVTYEDLERAGGLERGAGYAGSDRMTLEALLVHLLVHLAAHRFAESLRWVLDVLVLLDRDAERIDGARLLDVARRLRGHRAAGAAVSGIARLLPGVDLGPLAALRSGGLRARLAIALVDPVAVARLHEDAWSGPGSFASRALLGAGPGSTVALLYRKTRLRLSRRG